MGKCTICGREINSGSCLPGGGLICSSCEFLLTGNKMLPQTDYSFATPDGIVLWIKDFKVKDAWVEGGSRSMCVERYETDPVKALVFIRELISKKKTICDKCGKIISLKKADTYSFAGVCCNICKKKFDLKGPDTRGD